MLHDNLPLSQLAEQLFYQILHCYDADWPFSPDVDSFCNQDDFLVLPLHNIYGLCYKSISGKLWDWLDKVT